MIELVVVMLLASVLASLAAFSFTGWKNGNEQRGSADRLQSELRKSAVAAVTEGRTHCVAVSASAKTIQTWRYRCEASGNPIGVTKGAAVAAQGVHITFTPQAPVPAATSARPCPSGSTCVYFYPRGTATPAKFQVGSTKRSQTYSVNVEGLTSRVYR